MNAETKKIIHACCRILCAGSSCGIFVFLRACAALRVPLKTSADAHIVWALSSGAEFGTYLLLSNLVLLVVWGLYSLVAAKITRLPFRQILLADAYTYLPLCLLALPLLQFHTLFTTFIEALLPLSQSGGVFLIVLAGLGVFHLKRTTSPHQNRKPAATSLIPGWKTQVCVLLISASVYLAVGVRITDSLSPGGDEPHYLLMTHSLVHDGDIRILNNYNQRDYKAFYPGELEAHVSLGKDGTRYPGHPLGTSVMLMPAYALYGRQGAVILMNLLTALLAWQMYLLAFRIVQRQSLALLIWSILSFTPPLLIYSSQIYPEIPSALFLVLAYRLIAFPPKQSTHSRSWHLARLLVLSGSLAVLPWIQQRMILPALLLLGYHYVETGQPLQTIWRNPRKRLTVLIPTLFLGLSGLSLAGFYYQLYGNPLPNAPYISVGIMKVFSIKILLKEGLFGLLFDQEGGLLLYAPYYLLAFAGFWFLLRASWRRAAWLLLILLSVYLPCGGFTLKWRGAWSPAARYIVVLVPLFLVPLSVGLARATQRIQYYITVLLIVASAAWSWIFLQDPFLSIMQNSGKNAFFQQSGSLIDLTRYFPSFIETAAGHQWLVAGLWLLFCALFTLWYIRTSTTPAQTPHYLPYNEPTLQQETKTVFRVYAYGFVGFLLFSVLIEQVAVPRADHIPSFHMNRQVETMFDHLADTAVLDMRLRRETAIPREALRFRYGTVGRPGLMNDIGPRFLLTGPGEPFSQGHYTAYFTLTVADASLDDGVVMLDVTAKRGTQVFGRRILRGVDFTKAHEAEQFALPFKLPGDVEDLETRIYFLNTADITTGQIEIEPDLAERYYFTALQAMQAQQNTKARQAILQALSVTEHPFFWYHLGRTELNAGHPDAARHAFQQALESDPEFADAAYRLGQIARRNQDDSLAQQYFTRATTLLPTHLDAWKALQAFAVRTNQPAKAHEIEQRISELYQPQFPSQVNFGHQFLFLGYNLSNPDPGLMEIEYFWTPLIPMDSDYVIFVHFKGRNGEQGFQHDHLPHLTTEQTGETVPYPTSRWKLGELIREKFTVPVPAGTFDIELGVWEPTYSKQTLPVVPGPGVKRNRHQNKIVLEPVTLR